MIIYFIFNLNTNVIYEKQEKLCNNRNCAIRLTLFYSIKSTTYKKKENSYV